MRITDTATLNARADSKRYKFPWRLRNDRWFKYADEEYAVMARFTSVYIKPSGQINRRVHLVPLRYHRFVCNLWRQRTSH